MRYKRFLFKEPITDVHSAHRLLADLRSICNNKKCYVIVPRSDIDDVRLFPFNDVTCRAVNMPDGLSVVYLYDFTLGLIPDRFGGITYSSNFINENISTIMILY